MTQTVKLTKPIKAHVEEISELEVKEPLVADLRVLDEATGKIDQTIRLISKLGNIPVSSVEKMTAADFEKCDQVISSFFDVLSGVTE